MKRENSVAYMAERVPGVGLKSFIAIGENVDYDEYGKAVALMVGKFLADVTIAYGGEVTYSGALARVCKCAIAAADQSLAGDVTSSTQESDIDELIRTIEETMTP